VADWNRFSVMGNGPLYPISLNAPFLPLAENDALKGKSLLYEGY